MRVRILSLSLVAVGLAACVTDDGVQPSASVPFPNDICIPGQPAKSGTQPFTAQTIVARSLLRDELPPPPLLAGLGNASMEITTRSAMAQRFFDQGLRLAYAFNHAEARRAFRQAQRLDPECAMCWWGEAFVLGPNINSPMDAAAVEPAMLALRSAMALADTASEREQALIEALRMRYTDRDPVNRKALDIAWAQSMAEVAGRFPKDDDIQVLYAESVMNVSPWAYWEADRETPRGRMGEAIEVLERVLERDPEHAGAIHFYIHAVEASNTPERALPHARRLAALAPEAGHLVHMPSHIYYRIGKYREALDANIDAVAADERYFERSPSDPFYRNGYYPHNLHFMMAAAQMAGDGKSAMAAADKLDRVLDPALVRVAAVLQPVKAAPYFTHAQFATSDKILSLRDPGDEVVLVKAMWHYARAVAYAARNELRAGAREAARIEALSQHAQLQEIEAWGVPASDILRIAQKVAEARLADARDDLPAAAEHYRAAIALQEGMAYMEPPYWYYPVRQSLGAVQLRMGDFAGAERNFNAALEQAPNNGWALFGLQQTYQRQRDEKRLSEVTKRLDGTWFAEPGQLKLRRL